MFKVEKAKELFLRSKITKELLISEYIHHLSALVVIRKLVRDGLVALSVKLTVFMGLFSQINLGNHKF